jgi:hypothetical protein
MSHCTTPDYASFPRVMHESSIHMPLRGNWKFSLIAKTPETLQNLKITTKVKLEMSYVNAIKVYLITI